ncbi:MAG: DNA-protecting protein DprA [Gammaproteobacteria bacterium]|nr:DNA-protecting protein DprA [Gammaproteobacteria bacterium]
MQEHIAGDGGGYKPNRLLKEKTIRVVSSGKHEDELACLLALHRVPGLGARGLTELLNSFADPCAVLRAGRSELQSHGLSGKMLDYLGTPPWRGVEKDLQWLSQPEHHILTMFDHLYPSRLREIGDPPPLLFVQGDPEVLSLPQLALVGSRNPTPGGATTAFEFARYLAARGLVIVSGLALGIDGQGHKGALAANGITVAVAGTGVDRVYPLRHQELAHRIADNGAIVSEYPLGSVPQRTNFPRRNRIISGLSIGVLVVEAGRNSGSLITARLAVEQGREVFAIPGSIHNPLARGCHELIRQGAKLVESADDILEELVPLLGQAPKVEQMSSPSGGMGDGRGGDGDEGELDKEYRSVLDAMGYDPVSVDVLVGRTGLTAEELSSMLLILELQNLVSPVAGGFYSRVA